MQAVFVILYFVLGIFQIAAYLAGINLWLGIGTFWGLVIFFITGCLPFGSIVDAVIAFYGAHSAWHWPWWQAALLTFPFAVFGIAAMGLSGIAGLAAAFSRPKQYV
jgi:hypothetical protein